MNLPLQKEMRRRIVFDIEDLVTEGKSRIACPYFAARSLLMDAGLVFCPYNYLVPRLLMQSPSYSCCTTVSWESSRCHCRRVLQIDPIVRDSSGIDLTDAVVIFDEVCAVDVPLLRCLEQLLFKLSKCIVIRGRHTTLRTSAESVRGE